MTFDSGLITKCKGGDSCCSEANLCELHAGNCVNDIGCDGGLGIICGSTNCLTYHSAGGLWDSSDNCCERRCLPAHPCQPGQGICIDNADCGDVSKFLCDTTCLNREFFPLDQFPDNTASK